MNKEQSSVFDITSATFHDMLAAQPIVFVEIWATWCAPCRQFSKIYQKVAAQHPEIYFGQVNVEQETQLSELFEIRSVPHLMVFKEGIAIYSDSGALPQPALIELVEQALNADVSQIKAQLEEKGV